MAVARLHAEDVAIGERMGFFEAVILILEPDVEAPQITVVLGVGGLLKRIVDDAELEIGGAWGRNSRQVAQAILDNFIEAGHATIPRGPRRGEAADVEDFDESG